MTTTATVRDVRRAARDTQEPIVGGVAAGLARHLGLPVLWVRAGFVLAAALGGLGVVFYAGLWLVLPSDAGFEAEAPGLESASRGGRRPGRIRRLGDVGPAIALAALGFGAILVVEALLGQGAVFWPLFIALVGIALLWRQADEAQRERWLDTTGRIDPVRVVVGSGGWAAYARIAAGLALIVTALVLFSLRAGSFEMARDVTVAALLAVLGLAIVVGPWMYRLASDLTAERAERIRTQERADVAAHLHDSVLQTLALIQRTPTTRADGRPAGPRPGARPAGWLYAGRGRPTTAPWRARCGGLAAAVEDAHGVPVEVVVGRRLPARRAGCGAVVDAAREALVNAAKHAGAGQVDVYAEVGPTRVDVFVRDRGRGLRPGRRRRTTGYGVRTASSAGWSATAAPPRSAPRRARAPRCGCTCPRTRQEKPDG